MSQQQLINEIREKLQKAKKYFGEWTEFWDYIADWSPIELQQQLAFIQFPIDMLMVFYSQQENEDNRVINYQEELARLLRVLLISAINQNSNLKYVEKGHERHAMHQIMVELKNMENILDVLEGVSKIPVVRRVKNSDR